jgi:hypothetical protein
VREVHANNIETGYLGKMSEIRSQRCFVAKLLGRWIRTFAELIDLLDGVSLGTWRGNLLARLIGSDQAAQCAHTNGTDDGGTTVVALWSHLGIKLGIPFQLHTVGKVV